MTYTIAAFYRFTPVADVPGVVASLKDRFAALGISGSILVAPEGINGTMASSAEGIEGLLQILEKEFGMPRADVKFSYADIKPFKRLKVRPKKEILTFNQPKADPTKIVGQYVEAEAWNDLINDPEVLVLDTRNTYETMIGTFENALIPKIEKFTDFADYVRQYLDPTKHKKIAMFCTGGIRCEKASAFMLAEDFPEVYHLKGGILKYLENVPEAESKWQGDCYVFDRRMAVGHGLKTGHYDMCFCCGYALTQDEKTHEHYEQGVSCRHCYANTSEAQKAGFRMRQRQQAESVA